MSRVLEMVFNTELGTSKTIRVVDAKDPLTGAEVSAAMDTIIAKNIFRSNGGELVGKIKAQIVTITSTGVSLA
ncbi:MAG: DUF2922 domain-containing protein [Syntrophomonadaceae bacterium]|nr:DUF2922 domain-containing protein [Syntrophomonadaceae bacterium]